MPPTLLPGRSLPAAILALPATLFLACEPAKIAIGDPPAAEDTTAPDITIEPTLVDFGTARPGESVTSTVTVTNDGDADLTLSVPVLLDPNGQFDVVTTTGVWLAPGESTDIVVTFAPTVSGNPTATLVIPSDDPDEGSAEVMLLGVAVDPSIALSPAAIDFGTVFVGCTNLEGFTLTNEGDVALTIQGLEVAGGEGTFAVDVDEATNGPLPWTLGPQESKVVWAGFTPGRETTYSGSLVVYSDDPENPSAGAALDGSGTDALGVEETFLASGGTWDIVIAVDQSDSFSDERDELPAAVGEFADAMDLYAFDFQVALVADAGGCIAGGNPWVTGDHTSSTRVSSFEEMLDADDIDETLHGLDLLAAAVDEDRIGAGECNEGLVRADASLLLLGVTDGGERTLHGWSDYENVFDGLGPDYLVGYIGPADDCQGSTWGGVGTEWQEGARDTDGPTLSYCDDWADNFTSILDQIATPQTRFVLSGAAQEETLEVLVNGEAVTGWWYNANSRTVGFSDANAPAMGSTVTMRYDAEPSCD